MDKKSFYRSLNIAMTTLLILHILETVAMYWQFSSNNQLVEIIIDSKNILLSFLIIFVIFYISIIIYHPLRMKRSIKVLLHMLDEFRVGHYAFKASEQTEKLEKEFHPLIESIDKVFGNVLKFDKLKETKIYTHHSRIRGLMNLMEEGAMIVDNSGDIIYINDKLQENYKFLDEDVNIFENVYDNHFEEYMKKYINEVISSQMKKEATRMPLKDSDDEITVKSTMYKNKSGDVLGAIFLVSGLKDVASNKQNLVKKIS